MPSQAYLENLERQLAVLSEGFCPDHRIPLRLSGWCVSCQGWWSADFPAQHITVSFPYIGKPPET